ncbi:MAG: hypothetical protein ACM31E_01285 [Fibrobacterota bacterium]
MFRILNLVIRTTVVFVILVFSNCWFGVYQSAKLLHNGEHSVEPIAENVSATDYNDYYIRGGLRYTLGREVVNHQVLVLADLYGVTESDHHEVYTLQYGIKKMAREDKIALLFEFGVKSDLQSYTNGYFSYSPLFSVPVSAYTTFTIAPSLKINLINFDHKLIAMPCFGIAFNCETGFSKIKIVPEISAAYVYPSGFLVSSGIGIPIQFGTIRQTEIK